MYVVVLIIGIVQGIVWGIVADKIIENKGYKENWFWWGFFFSFFAMIVALTKPDVNNSKPVEVQPDVKTQPSKIIKTVKLTNRNYADSVDIKSPIHVESWNIQRENDDLFLIINFMNVSEITVSAVMFLVSGFNSFADKVTIDGKNEFEALGQDYSINPGGEETIKILLPDSSIRKVDIKVEKVCFIDGMTMTCEESEWIDTKQEEIDSQYSECVKQENIQGKYYAIIKPNYWQCVCGFVNTGETCKTCNMKKDNVLQFTREQIEVTYNKYLIDLEDIKRREEQRRLEAESIAAEEKRRKIEAELESIGRQKQKKRNIMLAFISGSVVLVAIIGIISFNYISMTKIYENDRMNVSSYIKEEEYDKAFSKMISSDNYDKLKEEYGDTILKKEKELDESFRNILIGTAFVMMKYNEEEARDGVCYFTTSTDSSYVWKLTPSESDSESKFYKTKSIYAMTNDGTKIRIFSKGVYQKSGRVSINDILWSNGWLFVSVSIEDTMREEGVYAIKYDVKTQQIEEIKIFEETGEAGSYCYAKMNDGTVIISIGGNLSNIQNSESVKMFDVVTGTVSDISYDNLYKMYDNDIAGNVLVLFEK